MTLLALLLGQARAATPEPHIVGALRDGIASAGDPVLFERWKQRLATPHDDVGMSVVLDGADPAELEEIAQLMGWPVEALSREGMVQVYVPYADLPVLEELDLPRVRQPYLAHPKAVTTSAVAEMNVEKWHEAGFKGKGVSIAILDVGFAGYESLLGEELPRRVTTNFLGDWEASNHGTAVAEIVHDLAPKAELRLVQFATDVEFLEVVELLGSTGVHVVNASIGFDNIWHANGESPYSRAVDLLSQQGITWVGAAGNENEKYRIGLLSDEDVDGKLEIAGEEEVMVAAPDGVIDVIFRWSDPMQAATNDLDLKAYNDDGSLCAISKGAQNGEGTQPLEFLQGVQCASSWVRISPVIDLETGIDPTGLVGYLYSYEGMDPGQTTSEITLTLPADAMRAFAIGACNYETGSVPSYSSRGPTEDGRIKPDFCAPNSGETASYDPLPFEGTSAASPHAAALAALILGGVGPDVIGPEEVRVWLQNSATDLGEEGPDNTFGHGAVMAGRTPHRRCEIGLVPYDAVIVAFGSVWLSARRRRSRDT